MKIVLALLFISLAGISYADTSGEDGWPSGSAMDVGLKIKKDTVRYEQRIEVMLTMLNKKLNHEYLSQHLEKQQTAWMGYRNSSCMVVGIMTGAGGTWPSTYANKCSNGLTYQRYLNVKNALTCVERHRRNKVKYGIEQTCLYQILGVDF